MLIELKPIINEKRNTTNIGKKSLIFRYKIIIITNNITKINKAKKGSKALFKSK